MSIQCVAGKLEGETRKALIQSVQKQLQEAAIGAIRPLLTEFCEAEVSAKLGRENRTLRRVSGQVREIDWQCGQCGCRDANQFTRDGHYRRALETGWGHIEGLQVPMLECQQCGHDVICTYTILEKYQRFWLDLDQRVLFGSGLCQSLRHLSQEWSAVLESSVGLRTINERINQIEPLLGQARTAPITDVPAVVQFDGMRAACADPGRCAQAGQTRTQAQEAHRQEGSAVGRVGVLDRWQWQTRDPGLADSR